MVVLSPPVVNETGFYCHIMLDEIEQSPFATPEDLTMRIEAEEQDLSEFGNSWGFDELYPIRFRSGNRNLKSDVSISGTFSGKKEILDSEEISLDKDDALVDTILRESRLRSNRI